MKVSDLHGRSFGVIAGRGLYPEIICKRLLNKGADVFVVTLAGQASAYAFKECTGVNRFFAGQINKISRYFLNNGVSSVIMAGGVSRLGISRYLKPDISALRLLVYGLKGDDFFLKRVADLFLKKGITVIDPSPYVSDLFALKGRIAGPDLSNNLKIELEIAFNYAAEFSKTDRGQTVSVYKGRLWKTEDIRGTDALIADLPGPGAVTVKTAKKNQDRRFDMPVIGPSTIMIAAKRGVAAIGVEAGSVLILDCNKVIYLCDKYNIILTGRHV